MILKSRGRGLVVEARDANSVAYMLEQLGASTRGATTFASSSSERRVAGLPAFGRGVEIKATQMAALDMGVWRGDLPTRTRVVGAWQARLFRGRPNAQQTSFDFVETIGTSLGYRSNAYVVLLSDPASGRVVEAWAMHPDQVEVCHHRGETRYEVCVDDGYPDPFGRGRAEYELLADQVVHVRDYNDGSLVALSRVERYRRSLGAMVARQDHEEKSWRRGARLELAVEFPADLQREKAEAWRRMFDEVHGGIDGHRVLTLGGGATAKPIGMSMRDAEFVEGARLSVEECARIVGVPASLLDATTASASLEQELSRWLRFGLQPELERVEAAFNEHPALRMDRERGVYFAFSTETFVRGDAKTEAEIMHMRVQSGVLLADEARAQLGLDPLPDGLGQIPQVVPVGGTPNPTPPPAQQNTRSRDAADGVVIHNHPAEVRVENVLPSADAPVVHVAPAEVRSGDVIVHVPEQPAPSVVVENVVNVPEQPAPIVEVEVLVPEPRSSTKIVDFAKDANGRVTAARIVEIEEDA